MDRRKNFKTSVMRPRKSRVHFHRFAYLACLICTLSWQSTPTFFGSWDDTQREEEVNFPYFRRGFRSGIPGGGLEFKCAVAVRLIWQSREAGGCCKVKEGNQARSTENT